MNTIKEESNKKAMEKYPSSVSRSTFFRPGKMAKMTDKIKCSKLVNLRFGPTKKCKLKEYRRKRFFRRKQQVPEKNIPWLLINPWKVSEKEYFKMIQSKIRCQTFCEGLVQEMTMHSSSDAFQSKCLALLVHIFDLPKKSAINAHLFSKSFIMSGGLGCVVRVIETFSTDLELQKLTMQVLARLLKGYIPVDHCCDRIPAAVVRTMNAFPSDEFIQTSSCYVLLCYSKNDPQRMKHVIAADGLEALAKACGNFPHSTKISEATKHLLNHAIVSFYQVFEETRDTKEKEYSTV